MKKHTTAKIRSGKLAMRRFEEEGIYHFLFEVGKKNVKLG
ncbi:hypothetical protein GAGA_2371 [Paraglaciecola agarilytica NO2]|uniref:Uncharacterized protein n=1 Tax=Paraglaciecola agarilytica NO2 TaxID=1125747 RepID=A0ABQ0I7E0_9ALTE|nr:hypothetical protein GAGA_2371 [Paraglaciecola agarilytica NO2]